jgi:hypothetical protein
MQRLAREIVRLAAPLAMLMLVGRPESYSLQDPMVRLRAPILGSLPLVPLVLAALTQAYLALALPNLPWVSPAWRARGIPLYLSFAVWEWGSCVVFSMCLLVIWRHRLDG